MTTLNISLAPELAALIDEKVRSGMYPSASEVVGEGLRLLREQDEVRRMRLEELRREIDKGDASLARGESREFHSGEELAAHIEAEGLKYRRYVKGKYTIHLGVMTMTQHCEAVYENGVFRPLAPLGSMLAEGQQVQLVVDTDTGSADILGLMAQVYAGLPDEDVDAIEQIALDRSHFSTRSAL